MDEIKFFNLTDEIIEADEIFDGEWLPMKSIQDFVMRLKYDFCNCDNLFGEATKCEFCLRIDKLAGNELNKGVGN